MSLSFVDVSTSYIMRAADRSFRGAIVVRRLLSETEEQTT